MPGHSSSVKVGDVSVRLSRAGAGTPVLFLHGAGGAVEWLPFFEALSRDYEILVPDHPGFGGSDDPSWIRSVRDVAMFYLDFLDALPLDGVHLIGHSLGGWIAAELAVRDCSRLRSLTLLAPAGVRVEGVPSGDMFMWNPEERARNLFHDQAFAERLLSLPPPTDAETDILLKNQYTTTKLGWQPRWYDPDLEKWLHRIKVPTQIIWGDDDKIMPAAYADRWCQRVPRTRLAMIRDCGHLPHVEKAEQVASELIKFLEEVAA